MQTKYLVKGLKVYKNLFYRETLEPTKSYDSFYTIQDLYDFVTGENTKTKDYHHLKHKLNNFYTGYNNNVDYITGTGLPNPKSEQFNFANLHKFYNKEIRVQSIMIEIRRDLYMDEKSGEKNYRFNKIKKTLEKIINVYLNEHW